MFPSSSLSAHNVSAPPPSTSQSTLKSFSVPPPPSHIYKPPSKTDALLSPPQPLPPRVSTVPFSPPRSISLFLNPNFKASKSESLNNFVRSSANKHGFHGQVTIIGIPVAAILVAIIIALIICYRKRKNDVPLDSDRLPTPQPNDAPHNAPSPQHLPQISYLPGVHGNPMRWNVIPPTIRLSNSKNPSPNTEVQGTPVLPLCGGDFTIQELSLATRCFSQANLLGESEFGSVHKGVLPNGRRITVKWLKMDSSQGMQEVFQQEVEMISRVHHKHLVPVVGYCVSSAERLLVCEFVPNNNLEFHLHGKGQPVMKWASRMKIAIGSAKGLAYLHEDCNPSIFHLNIKASNILLDSSFEAKISDFGLPKTLRRTKDDDDDDDDNDDDDDDMPNVIGDVENSGYLAPEYAARRKSSNKADAFSYGVLLLELITGCNPLNTRDSLTNGFLVPWARPLLNKALETKDFHGLADPRLQEDYNSEEMASMVACAAACIRNPDWRRPRMSEIILVLEGNISWSDLSEGTPPVRSSSRGVRASRSRYFNRRR
ncbi:Proline-rich receptor-like protein kinase PERK2 [Heracleum sosnowskyi]|uniref:non-specific serine/threonine protein kinase n=1 Tax=Heracleum sosnowskyi TaxID=360622 RepID=A0AAD8HSH9_9APIA|nr:Proline-rich receptor-like protein kinase PERK2 [Heracleum sosnowskyi]